jgi:hypothetical protein
MKLLHLKIACYLYNQFTDYDSTYLELSDKYPNLDLNQPTQIKALIEWLRSWGCRQFKSENEGISIDNIAAWYKSNHLNIPLKNANLIDYDLLKNKRLIIDIFNDLSERSASERHRGNTKIHVHIGPVGAAKTLFALNSNLFAPWDTSIYQDLELEGNGSGYVGYLEKIQKELIEIRNDLINSNIQWNGLFIYLEKKHKSYPKLIDEYYWIKITKKCDPSKIESFCNNQ